MSENQAPASSETATTQAPPTPHAPETQTPSAPPQAPQNLSAETPPTTKSGLDFIPEQYRNSSWATKYQTPDDFFKGVENLNKLAGQKQVVQGIQAPGEDATDEDWNKFYNQIGRPESADKYALPEDVQAPEGLDLEATKNNFKSAAHKAGLNQKQTTALFKEFIESEKQKFAQSEEKRVQSFDQAVKQAFPEDPNTGLAMAKKAAKALGVADILDQEGLSLNPTVLQLCAKLGELAGEDSFVKSNTVDSKESALEKAKRLQKTPEYWKDQKVFDEVQELYKQGSKK